MKLRFLRAVTMLTLATLVLWARPAAAAEGQCTNPISQETFCCAHQAVTEFIEHVQIVTALGFLTPMCGNSLIAFVLRAESSGPLAVIRFRDLELQLTALSGGDTESLQNTLTLLFALDLVTDPVQRLLLLDLLILTDPHLPPFGPPLSNCFIRLTCPETVAIPVPWLPSPIFIGGGTGVSNPHCEEFRRIFALLLAADLRCAEQLTLIGDTTCETPVGGVCNPFVGG